MGTAHFTDKETACHCCGVSKMDKLFMDRLERLRVKYGKPMVITSGYRCPKHNQAVSFTGDSGPHTKGQAVDVAVSGADAYALLSLALEMNFSGIGVSQKGSYESRYIHLDDCIGSTRPWVWSY